MGFQLDMFGKNKKNKTMIHYLALLFFLLVLVGCDSGWTIMGWEVK